MMKFLHHLLNPHCQECKLEHEENKICQSCEILKMQLALVNQQNEKLLARLTEKPEPKIEHGPPQITRPLTVPWSVRRQILEKDDREKARILRDAPKSLENKKMDEEEIKKFEKELDNATAARKEETANQDN